MAPPQAEIGRNCCVSSRAVKHANVRYRMTAARNGIVREAETLSNAFGAHYQGSFVIVDMAHQMGPTQILRANIPV